MEIIPRDGCGLALVMNADWAAFAAKAAGSARCWAWVSRNSAARQLMPFRQQFRTARVREELYVPTQR
ncbi:MAG: hypothetical protein WDM96_06400 [Lacunisphaera sp.]